VPSARYAETGFWFNTALGGLGNAEFTSRFPGIREALLSLPCKSAIIDVEVVARREDGSPDFRALHSGNNAEQLLVQMQAARPRRHRLEEEAYPIPSRASAIG
jgi:hypothetical protein